MGCLSEEQQSSLSNFCGSCLDQCRCTCESIKATSYRLKWNWFFVIALSLLVSNGASSPMGTLHEFVTNPTYRGGSSQEFEPGLGESEAFYSWVISINNIGGFLGGVAGVLCTTILPYWFSFMISLACHTFGFLLYAVVTHGWMLIVGRLLVGIFTGLHRSLTFAYFAVTYEYYISENQESKKYCRIKDILFALYTVSTSLGFLIGAGVSVVFSKFNHIDHFRAIGWYNTALGFAFFVLLVFTFHGEFRRTGRHTGCMNLKLIRNTASKCCNKSNITLLLIVIFLIVCTAVIKSRVTIYEELFNPILSDAFGFSEDYTVYFFLIILVAPILGGIYLFLIQWTRVNNIMISIFGIIATIMALLIMSDWQATLNDTCLEFSLYHNPHFGSTDASHIMPPTQHCWSAKNWSSVHPSYYIISMDHGHLELAFKPDSDQQFQRRLICDVYQSGVSCDACSANKTFRADLSIKKDGQDICLEKSATVVSSEHLHDMRELTIKCHAKSNEPCDIVCLHLYNSNNPHAGANLQEFEYDSPTFKNTYKSLIEDVYAQSLTVVGNNIYTLAMEQCEAHTEEHCHWIPNSVITKQHCGDCQPICRSVRHSLNFIQFSIGAFWFMFSMPVAEVSLPLIISDSVREQFQGIVMGITVASSEFLQGITPLWLNAAYEASGKRTFLPNIILIATFLPFLFGLCALYQTLVELQKSIHPDSNSKTS